MTAFNHPDRLLPSEPKTRDIARALYTSVRDCPIVSPHGHTDPQWFAQNAAFQNATSLLIQPDHYVYRMLYSQGISLQQLGIGVAPEDLGDARAREIWRLFASKFYLFRATPSRLWFDDVFQRVFGFDERLSPNNADDYYDRINAALATPAFRPRALMDRFNIECIATTESALDPLQAHRRIQQDGWGHRVITAYRPDSVVDPEFEGFLGNLAAFSTLTGEDCMSWQGYLAAHRKRRADFKAHGATSSDHGHMSARTANLSAANAERLFQRVLAGASAEDAELFRAQMLTEMARMSLDDGLILQIHPGSFRNHNLQVFAQFGRDRGADIPTRTDYVQALKPLLDAFGNETNLSVIVFTLDESTYARELAPLAGHYPCLKLGPAWWFHDSPEGMRRFRHQVTETAGLYNTVGFNDDTRAFLSIPARHDVSRRVDCGFLAELVAEHRLEESEAFELAQDLAHRFAREAYRLPHSARPLNPPQGKISSGKAA
jgi:glucuronate isomerase